MRIYWDLFVVFFKIGLFTFGGGYAMLPLIQKEVIKKNWATEEEILDYYAIGQITPGIIAINVSTFIGYKTKGMLGAVFSMIGMITPSVCIITLLAIGLARYWENPVVAHAFAGIRLVIPALIIPTLFKMIKKSIVNPFSVFVATYAFFLCFFNVFPVLYITILSGMLGLFYNMIKENRIK